MNTHTDPSMRQILADLFGYMRTHKKLWLLPVIVAVVAVAALLWLAQGTALAPFIYSIF